MAAPTHSPLAAFEAVTVVEGLLPFAKRSSTLDGAIPLRAAQWCKPFLEGNASGFHFQFAQTAVLLKTEDGAALQMTDEAVDRVTADYDARIERAVERGFLERDGYWHRRLREGFAWQDGDTFHIWTGHIVRPSPGVWLHVHTPYNRRCQVKLPEYVIADDGEYVPLVLPLDLRTLTRDDAWLDTELACVTPLCPNVRIERRTLREVPEAGRLICAFYDPDKERNHAQLYREQVAGSGSDAPDEAAATFVTCGGPDVHRIRTFEHFAGRDGWRDGHPRASQLEWAEIGLIYDVAGCWDGMLPRDFEFAADPAAVEQLVQDWRELYGEEKVAVLDTSLAFARGNTGPQRREPIMVLHHWLMTMTPPGWSAFVDAYDVAIMEGLRGVTATDVYPGIAPVWQFEREGRFLLPQGSSVGRVIPTPRKLLQAAIEASALS
jgi:hypothetical protein